MNKLLLLVLLLAVQSLYAQVFISNHSYHQFQIGSDCKLIADNVNVREEASTKASIIANIPIGTDVKILKQSSKTLKLKGFSCNWYKVSFSNKGKKTEGYIWGGLIADAFIESSEKDVYYMVGITTFAEVKKNEYYSEYDMKVQVRASKNNKELDRIEFKVEGGLSISRTMERFGDKSVAGIKDIFEFGVSQNMCAGLNEYYVIFWDGKKLFHVADLTPGGDAPYYFLDEFIYPEDEENRGKKGRIIRNFKEGYYDDTGDKDVVESHHQVEYEWTGKELKKIKEVVLVERREE